MINQGPFPLVANVSQVLTDPFASTGGAAGSIQIQNQSGFVLTVSGFGSPVIVQAILASTIPLPTSGCSVTIDPASSVSQGSESVYYVVWLLPGETSDVPNGPLTTAQIDITGGQVTANFAAGSQVALVAGTSVAISSGSVAISNTPAVTIDTAGGAVSVSAAISNTVTANATIVNTPAVTVSGTTVVQGVAGGTAIGIAGSVSVSSGTVSISGTPAVTIASGTVDIGTAPALTIDNVAGGTINIAEIASGNQLGAQAVNNLPLGSPAAPTITNIGTAGTTRHNYQIVARNSFNNRTTPSPVSTTTTSNATLDSTNYNQQAITAAALPAGSPGNLVYDSNLVNTGATLGDTWASPATFGGTNGTFGSAAGDFFVMSPGQLGAYVGWYGTGSSSANLGRQSQLIDVIPGQEYTLSAVVDGSASTTNGVFISVYPVGSGAAILQMQQVSGVIRTLSGQLTIPSGVSQVVVAFQVAGATVPTGSHVAWQQIQLTQTSTVQPYAPGPLFTYETYRDGYHVPAIDTTTLVSQDQGQAASIGTPPSFDTTGQMLQVYTQETDALVAPISDGASSGSYSSPTAIATLPAGAWTTLKSFSQSAIVKRVTIMPYTTGFAYHVAVIRANGQFIMFGVLWVVTAYVILDAEGPISLFPGDSVAIFVNTSAQCEWIILWTTD